MDYFIRTDQNLIDLIFKEKTLEKDSPLFKLRKRFLQARVLNFDIYNYFKDLEETTELVIDSEGEELKIDEPEKKIIKQLSKLPLSKLLDLQDISKLPFDQYQITKNTLFYVKQQNQLKPKIS
ncbi:hypothetical protein F8M41_007826 [Gigaspora margarita]|uniref:Uncharacterized protein n=1 Tax=Gigaspora margarita TaxID=4874 RepID=A0A8H4AW67_GIGMA|nr:hypothetical protein F8M41_007826 [Gigaspora margarita]